MAVPRERGLRFGYQIQNFLQRFPELSYDGTVIKCDICMIQFDSLDSTSCRRHVKSQRHIKNRKADVPYWVFWYDLIFVFSVCNIPLHVLGNTHFRSFWQKFVTRWDLPTAFTARRKFPRLKLQIEQDIRSELQDKKVWITVDETTEKNRHKVGNVLVRILTPEQAMLPYVIASKRLTENTANSIHQLVIEAVEKFGILKENILMLVTDESPYMIKAGASLKTVCPNLLHITCLLLALHRVTETIRSNYPEINSLIAQTKKVFFKAPQRINEFHQLCPGIPEPPEPVLTRWGTWLQAVFYYDTNFHAVKSVVNQFDPNESNAIKESQQLFESAQMEADLRSIQEKYSILANAIDRLEKTSVSLVEAVEIVENVNTALRQLTDACSFQAATKFDAVLQKNPGWVQLRNIKQRLSAATCTHAVDQYFTYASITSLDVERSFSNYKAIFTEKRTNLKEATVEGVLMMQAFAQANNISHSIR